MGQAEQSRKGLLAEKAECEGPLMVELRAGLAGGMGEQLAVIYGRLAHVIRAQVPCYRLQ